MQTRFHQSAFSSFFFKEFLDSPFKNLSRLKPLRIQASLDQTEKPAGYIMIIPNKIRETFSHPKNQSTQNLKIVQDSKKMLL